MNPLNRRDILRWGLLGAGSTSFASWLAPLHRLAKASSAGAGAPSAPLLPVMPNLLVIFQRGAADGMHTVIPVGDPSYPTVRGTPVDLTIPPNERIPFAGSLDGFAMLNKYMAPLVSGANGPGVDNKLAIVTRVGNPNTNRSHFEQQDIWESAADPALTEGWVARLAATAGYPPEFGIAACQERQPRMMASTNPLSRCVHIKSLNAYSLKALDNQGLGVPPAFADALELNLRAHLNQTFPPGIEAQAAGTNLFALDTMNAVQAINGSFVHDPVLFPANDTEAGNVGLPPSPVGYAFSRRCEEAVAVLQDPGTNCRAVAVEIGGWDTHTNQRTRLVGLADLLYYIMYGAYVKTRLTNTIIMIVTEFGRQIFPNIDGGTDHAVGYNCVITGASVKSNRVVHCHGGGGYGSVWQNLDQILLNPPGNLRVPNDGLSAETDWRAFLWELMDKRGGLSPAQIATIIPNFTPNVAGQPWTAYPNIFKIDHIGQP